MGKVWRFCQKWWWTFLLFASVVAFIAWKVVRNAPPDGVDDVPPVFLEVAKDQVARVNLEAELEKVRVKALADQSRMELDIIEAVGEEDPREGRRQMSDWMRRNL